MTDGELEMVESLCAKLGGIPKSDLLRRCLQERYLKVFPVYLTKKRGSVEPIERELTPEEACEKAGGKVVTREGTLMCQIKVKEGYERNVPLTRLDLL